MLIQYELGNVSTEQFVTRFLKYQDSVSSEKELIDAWNAILKDFPTYRLDFIKKLNGVVKILIPIETQWRSNIP